MRAVGKDNKSRPAQDHHALAARFRSIARLSTLRNALPSMMMDNGQSATQVGTAFALIGILRSLLHAAIWAAVLFAIFSGRVAAPAK